MNKNTIPFAQSLKYAQDLSSLYKIERAKQAELEEAFLIIKQKNDRLEQEKLQLLSYAEDIRSLYQQLLISHSKTERANLETIYRLSLAAEFRDEQTADHLRRISGYSKIIANAMQLDKKFVKLIEKASPMHDIGKIGISDKILLKPGKHTPAEKKLMEQHTYYGHNILKHSESSLLQMAEKIAYTHHEKFDGSGYPRQLKGDQIPLEGRIVAVADVFDALSTKRIYKPAFSVSESIRIMKKQCLSHFDPEVFQAFLDSRELVENFKNYLDQKETTAP